MEIIDNKPQERPNRPKSVTTARNVYLGLALVAAGVIWMCYNLDLIGSRFFDVVFSWQMLLIVLGGYLLSVRKWIAGGIVSGIGVLFALSDWFDITLPVSEIILPIIVIAIGVGVLLQRGN